jgi:hypothetical protein
VEKSREREVGGRRGNVATGTTWRGAEGAREVEVAGPARAPRFRSRPTRLVFPDPDELTSPFAVCLSNHLNPPTPHVHRYYSQSRIAQCL